MPLRPRSAIGLAFASVVVAAAVLLAASVSSQPSQMTLPVPAGTVYRVGYLKEAFIHFSTSSPMTLVGAWRSDAPAGTGVASTGQMCFALGGCPNPPLGCSVTYNVTLAPGNYVLGLASPYLGSANITATQAIQLVPPAANTAPVSGFWMPSSMGPCLTS